MMLPRQAALRTLVTVVAVVGLLVAVPSSSAISGAQKWAIVLCNFTNQTAQPNSLTYYQQMFQGAGSSSLDFVDYWRDNSYSQVDVSATTVTGWHTIASTRDAWAAMNRFDKQVACGNAAEAGGFSFAGYYGFVTIFPEAKGALGAAAASADTTITVTTAAAYNFYPTPPFNVNVDDGSLPNGGNNETMTVTAISGNQFTVTRGVMGTTAQAHNNGAGLIVPGDLFGRGASGFTLGGNSYTLGSAVLPHDVNLTGAAHETGHGFNYDHSRKLSTSTTDYNDCYDIMSAYATCSFSGDFGLSNLGSVNAAAGPGITGILLDVQGWLPAARVVDLNNAACNQTTLDLVALNQPGVAGTLVARIPAAVVINTPGNTTTTSSKYWLEYREATGWDQGVPPGVILHLRGGDGFAYWVDSATADGRLVLGEEFVDASQNTYVAINGIDTVAHKAKLTMAGCKLDASMAWAGDTTGDYSDAVTLAGDLTVTGSAAPIPNQPVTLTLGSQSCSATTNSAGRAQCSITLNQIPGSYTAGAAFAGDAAYNSANASASFTITREDSQVTYTGPSEKDYHDAFTASGTLVDPDSSASIAGRTVTFTLGATDVCSATTDGSGASSCSITPSQVPGSYTMATVFAGDAYYEPSSDADSFEITKEETQTTYNGPTVILQGASGVTLKAELLEGGPADVDGDGTTAPPVPAGQTLTLSLGSQSCTGIADATGTASCSLTFTGALGSQPLKAEFAGDAYYLPSSDTGKTAIVFAFPSRGAFTLGNSTDAAATPTTTVTWWSNSWGSLNSLTGGPTPSAFKGFAGTVTKLPTTSPTNVCGTSFTTTGGNSPPPTSGVPSYMGVLVTSSVGKSGSTIAGTWAKIVVVKVEPGYDSSPGHPGTGTIVATFCN
jgi:hypothetical protein